MNCGGDQLLAGAALAGEQHGRVGGRDARNEAEHRLHRRALADEAVLDRRVLAEPLVLAGQPLQMPHAIDGQSGHRADGGDHLQIVLA